MARLTTRDYKSTQHRPLELRRWREFGYGVLAGAVLATLAFVYLGGRAHRSTEGADTPHPIRSTIYAQPSEPHTSSRP